MEVSSELLLAAESGESVLFVEREPSVDLHDVAGEEFPLHLPFNCDWMLHPASQRTSRRLLGLLAVTVAALLIAISFCVVYWPARSSSWVSALKFSSSP